MQAQVVQLNKSEAEQSQAPAGSIWLAFHHFAEHKVEGRRLLSHLSLRLVAATSSAEDVTSVQAGSPEDIIPGIIPVTKPSQACHLTIAQSLLGALVAGIGMTYASKLFAALNIPTISAKSSKQRERGVGPVVEQVAKQTCVEACAQERMLTLAAEVDSSL